MDDPDIDSMSETEAMKYLGRATRDLSALAERSGYDHLAKLLRIAAVEAVARLSPEDRNEVEQSGKIEGCP